MPHFLTAIAWYVLCAHCRALHFNLLFKGRVKPHNKAHFLLYSIKFCVLLVACLNIYIYLYYKSEKPSVCLSVCLSVCIPFDVTHLLSNRCEFQSVFSAKRSAHHLGTQWRLNRVCNCRRYSSTARWMKGCRAKAIPNSFSKLHTNRE